MKLSIQKYSELYLKIENQKANMKKIVSYVCIFTNHVPLKSLFSKQNQQFGMESLITTINFEVLKRGN